MINGLPVNAVDVLRGAREAAKGDLEGCARSKVEVEADLEALTQRGYRLTQYIAKLDVAIEKLSKSEG